MNSTDLHIHLKRQINKFLSEEIINDNPSIQKFIDVVNQSYLNYEKDAELFEQSIRLNDIEFYDINNRIKDQLDKKRSIQEKLIGAIKQLNTNNDIALDADDNLIELLQILQNEIEFKKEISPTWTLYAIFCCASNENSQNTIHFNSITKNMTKRHLFPFTFNREKKPI